MSKVLNIILVALMVVLVATFLVFAISLQTKTDKVLSQYAIKREELAGRQQQIQDLVATLNSTIQTEVQNQKVIADALNVTLKTTNVTPPKNVTTTSTATTSAATTPKTTTVQSQPAPAPAPVRVTRAS